MKKVENGMICIAMLTLGLGVHEIIPILYVFWKSVCIL